MIIPEIVPVRNGKMTKYLRKFKKTNRLIRKAYTTLNLHINLHTWCMIETCPYVMGERNFLKWFISNMKLKYIQVHFQVHIIRKIIRRKLPYDTQSEIFYEKHCTRKNKVQVHL